MRPRLFRVQRESHFLEKVVVQRGKRDVTVVVEGNQPMAYKVFPVDSFRLSMDLVQVRSNLKFPELTVGHMLLTRIRIGQHRDKLRLVFDVTLALNTALKYAVTARANQVAVRFVKI